MQCAGRVSFLLTYDLVHISLWPTEALNSKAQLCLWISQLNLCNVHCGWIIRQTDKAFCRSKAREVDQKLWPNIIFGRFPHCKYYNVKLKSAGGFNVWPTYILNLLWCIYTPFRSYGPKRIAKFKKSFLGHPIVSEEVPLTIFSDVLTDLNT